MSSASRYDAVVVGGGLAGVVTATLLAKRGRKVALVEPRSEWGGRYPGLSIGGFTVASGPTLAMDYCQFGAADLYFETIGLSLPVLTRQGTVVRREPIQTIHGRHRAILAQTRTELVEELQREYGQNETVLNAMITDLEASRHELAPLFDGGAGGSSVGRWTNLRRQAVARAFVSRLSGVDLTGYAGMKGWSSSLGSYLAMLGAFVAPSAAESSLAAQVFRVGTLMKGLVALPEGTAGLCRTLVARFEALGGEVVRASVTKVDFGPRPSLEVGGQRFETGVLIVNSQEPPGATSTNSHDARSVSDGTLVVTVPERCVPEPMARHLLVWNDEAGDDRLAQGPWALTQLGSEADMDRGMAISLREKSAFDAERAMEQTTKGLVDLMPFSGGNITCAGYLSDREVPPPISGDLWDGPRWRSRRFGWAQAGRFPIWWLADGEAPWIRDASEYHAALMADRIVAAA